jgi:predicted metal-dependent phosphoesterase TrpH
MGAKEAALKTIVHVHTNYSFDANVSPEELIETALGQGVECLAVTDHDEIAGALEARAIGGVRIIIGEEISSADGHVIGLFLRELVPPGLSLEETAERIRAQGGLVLAPHPRAYLCDNSLSAGALERLLPWLDAVEVCNAQNPLLWEEAWARRFARRHGVLPYAGADSHVRGYLAAAYQIMPAFDGPADFLTALANAELHTGRFGPGYFVAMAAQHYHQRLFHRPLAGFGVNAPGVKLAGAASRG